VLSTRTALHNDESAPVEIVVQLTHDRSVLCVYTCGKWIADGGVPKE